MFEIMNSSPGTLTPYVPGGITALVPTSNSPSSMAYGASIPAFGSICYSGGVNTAGGYTGGLWVLNLGNGEWSRTQHAYNGERKRLCMFQNTNYVEVMFGPGASYGSSAVGFNKNTSQVGSLSFSGTPRDSAVCVNNDMSAGTAYVFGGLSSAGVLLNDIVRVTAWANGAEVFYNPSNKPPARRAHAGVLVGTKFYVFGGIGESSATAPMKDLWVYDIPGNTWTRLSDAPLGLMDTVMFAFNGFIYTHGGGLSTDISQNTRQVLRYEIAANKWVEMDPSPYSPRRGCTVTTIGSKAYIIGGMEQSGTVVTQVLSYTP